MDSADRIQRWPPILAIELVDEMVHVLGGNKPTYEKEPPSSPDELVERIASAAG